MGKIYVERDPLQRFGRSTEKHQRAYEQAKQSLADVRVDSDAFGRIPYVSGQLRQAYDEHVTACEDGAEAAAEAAKEIAEAIRTTLENYDSVEEGIIEQLNSVARLLGEGAG